MGQSKWRLPINSNWEVVYNCVLRVFIIKIYVFSKAFQLFLPFKASLFGSLPPPPHTQCSSDSVFRTVGAICQALLNPVTLGAGSWSHWSDKQLLQGWTLFLPICGLFFCWVDLSIPSSCKGKITLILTFTFIESLYHCML